MAVLLKYKANGNLNNDGTLGGTPTVTNGPMTYAGGKLGQAFDFQAGQIIDTGVAASMTTAIMDGFFKFDQASIGDFAGLLYGGQGADGTRWHFQLRQATSGLAGWGVSYHNGSRDYTFEKNSGFVPMDEWIHLLMLGEFTGSQINTRLFVNGVEEHSGSGTSNFSTYPATNFRIGRGGSSALDGLVDDITLHDVYPSEGIEQYARDRFFLGFGRLGKSHPAIAAVDKLIDNAGGTAPGFILAPGVPGAAAVGDGVVADQATDPIAHGELKLSAAIASSLRIGSFASGNFLDTDGSDDHVGMGEIGSFGSTVNSGWLVCAFMGELAGAGTLFGGANGSSDGVELIWTTGGDLQWGFGDGSLWFKTLTSDEAVDPERGVVAVLSMSDAANSFVIAGGKRISVSDLNIGGGSVSDFTAARVGDQELNLALGSGGGAIAMRMPFFAAVARSSAISESTARSIWSSMQAGGGLFPLPGVFGGVGL